MAQRKALNIHFPCIIPQLFSFYEFKIAFYWNFGKWIETGETSKISNEQLPVWQWGEAGLDHMPTESAFDFSSDRPIKIIQAIEGDKWNKDTLFWVILQCKREVTKKFFAQKECFIYVLQEVFYLSISVYFGRRGKDGKKTTEIGEICHGSKFPKTIPNK